MKYILYKLWKITPKRWAKFGLVREEHYFLIMGRKIYID
jgi:hypothetical protein